MNEKSYAALTALSASEQRFHAIADYTVDWENWIGPDGKLIWVNLSVERLTGYTVKECLAMPDFPMPLLADEADRARLSNEFGKAVRGNNFEFLLRQKDGGQRWASVSWPLIFGSNNESLGNRSSVRDITDRKHMELDLHDKVMTLEQSENIQKRLVAQAYQEQALVPAVVGDEHRHPVRGRRQTRHLL